MGSSGSSAFALGVDWFVRVRLLRSGAPLWSLGSFKFIWLVWVRPGGRSVGSGSHECVLWVAGFMGLLRFVAPWGALGS